MPSGQNKCNGTGTVMYLLLSEVNIDMIMLTQILPATF